MNTNVDPHTLLDNAGLRPTKARLVLLKLFFQSEHPLLHREIEEQIEEQSINRVTIYRTLHSFEEAGIVYRVETDERVWRFALCTCKSHTHTHSHFTCNECGVVISLDHEPAPPIPDSLHGFQIDQRGITMKGRCPQCINS